MKRVLSVLALSLLVGGGFSSSALAGSQEKRLASLFQQICLNQLPDYVGVREILEEKGYELAPYGDWDTATEFEFGHPETTVWGGFEISSDDVSCAVYDENIAENQMRDIAQQIIRNFSGEEPDLWRYNGDPSAWTVPYNGRVFYVLFNDGLAADIRDE